MQIPSLARVGGMELWRFQGDFNLVTGSSILAVRDRFVTIQAGMPPLAAAK
jgi:hypothetical protein